MTDNQFEQLFGLMTKAVSSIQNLEIEVKELRQGQDELRQGQETQGRKLDDFIDETRQNFVEVKKEQRLTNRKVNMLNDEKLEVRAEIRDLEDRVEVLEEKQAV